MRENRDHFFSSLLHSSDGLEDGISPFDRSVHYGDGLFETIPCIAKKLLNWNKHCDRMQQGIERLHLGALDYAFLKKKIDQVLHNQSEALTTRCVVKLVVTRGGSDRGYQIPRYIKQSNVFLFLFPWPKPSNSPIKRAVICNTRLGRNRLLAGIKHLNRLEQVLARSEWDAKDIVDGIMLDETNLVIEGTSSNLFVVSQRTIYTPKLDCCGINGIIRSHILDTAKTINFSIEISRISIEQLFNSDELFFSNSIMGIQSADSLLGYNYKTKKCADLLATTLQKNKFIPSVIA